MELLKRVFQVTDAVPYSDDPFAVLAFGAKEIDQHQPPMACGTNLGVAPWNDPDSSGVWDAILWAIVAQLPNDGCRVVEPQGGRVDLACFWLFCFGQDGDLWPFLCGKVGLRDSEAPDGCGSKGLEEVVAKVWVGEGLLSGQELNRGVEHGGGESPLLHVLVARWGEAELFGPFELLEDPG